MVHAETKKCAGLQRDRDSILGKMVRVTFHQRPEDLKELCSREHEAQMQRPCGRSIPGAFEERPGGQCGQGRGGRGQIGAG